MKVSREEWLKIESGETGFLLSDDESPSEPVAIVFVDAFTGTHLGNAIAHGLHIAKIAASGPIKSGVNPRYSLPIFQARQPALESFALDNFKHAQSVTHE
jgi:hypothetical protein